MNLFKNIGAETIYREYKESVLSHFPPKETTFQDLFINRRLSLEYETLIEDQINYDLWKYIPRYMSCFYNSPYNKHTHRWFYGVSDTGIITGIPVIKDRIRYLRYEFHRTVKHLLNNSIAILIDEEDYIEHKAQCDGIHTKVNYRHRHQFFASYRCTELTKNLQESIRFHVIPLNRPSGEQLQNPQLNFITEITSLVAKNKSRQDQYHEQYRGWQTSFKVWIKKMNLYSSKISDLLGNDRINEQFSQFIEATTILTDKDYCNPEKDENCFAVKSKGIRDPPFMEIFRKFRDENRNSIRKHRPVRPQIPKDYRFTYATRLAYSNYLLLSNPEVTYIMLQMTLDKRDKSVRPHKLAFLYNGHWHYQARIPKKDGDPQCI